MGAKILITGATGNIGAILLDKLREKKVDVIAGVSPRQDIKKLESKGIKATVIDFDKPETVLKVLKEVDRVFLLFPLVEKIVEWGKNAVDSAKEAGVKHILRSSALGADIGSEYAVSRIQGEIDQAVIDSGISNTIIRPNSFMQNFIIYYGESIKYDNALYLPLGAGKTSFIDVRDVATVASEILINPEGHEGKIYDLTGSSALSNHDVADILSAETGKDVQYLPIEDEMAVRGMQEMGRPQWDIDVLMSFYRLTKEGLAAEVSSNVRDITGNEPLNFENFVKDHVKSWQ